MASKNLLAGLLLAAAVPSAAQNENAVWLFNNETGLDFMTDPPTVLHDYFGYGGNVSMMSDQNGQLVLFADDEHIWNAQNEVVANGDGLIGTNGAGGQSNMILPWPGHPGEYYMIQVRGAVGNDPDAHARYHRIDMNVSGGSGEVLELNAVLADSAGGYVTSVLDSVGTGIWVILHHLNAPRFMAYHLDVSGLSTTPVVSEAGPPIPIGSIYDRVGILRPSPHGDRLYLAKYYNMWANDAYLHQMEFNRQTGEISQFQTVYGPSSHTGLEISPSGQFLYDITYVCDSGIATRLWQFDVSSGDSATITASRTLVFEAPIVPFGGCQGRQGGLALGIDSRIYCGISFGHYLGVINNPDLPAPACDYVHEGLYLEGDSSWTWLPNQMREYPIDPHDALAEPEVLGGLRIHPNPAIEGVRIILTDEDVRSLALVDATGRTVREMTRTAGQRQVRIERGDLAPGIYQVIARNAGVVAVAAGSVVFE